MSTAATIKLWGRSIAAVSSSPQLPCAEFQYVDEFTESEIQPAPLMMPLAKKVYRFPALNLESFHGLPGMLADSLPDKFGNALIDAWLATQGRTPDSMNAIERLCYTGARGMGALEYVPAVLPRAPKSEVLEMEQLVRLASRVMQNREDLNASFSAEQADGGLLDILRVGTSAGGARAKAVIAWNPGSNEVRSGQLPVETGFEHWLLKFDGVSENRDKELVDPQGYGAIEYAYHLMARDAQIDMSDCRLLEENGRRHFMTRRFDRLPNGSKLHMQSLCAMAHLDFNLAGAHSYEQAMLIARRLKLPNASVEQLFRRMVFNIVARNQDDHTKNIAFLMNKQGEWSLAPAYDVVYSYQPTGRWTSQHQMSLNGKRDGFELADFRAAAKIALLPRGRAERILADVQSVVSNWQSYARKADIAAKQAQRIEATLRLAAFT